MGRGRRFWFWEHASDRKPRPPPDQRLSFVEELPGSNLATSLPRRHLTRHIKTSHQRLMQRKDAKAKWRKKEWRACGGEQIRSSHVAFVWFWNLPYFTFMRCFRRIFNFVKILCVRERCINAQLNIPAASAGAILNPLLDSRVSFLRDHATAYARWTDCRSARQDCLSRESISPTQGRIPLVQRVHNAWPIRVRIMIFLAIEPARR